MKIFVSKALESDLSPEQIKGEALKLNLPCVSQAYLPIRLVKKNKEVHSIYTCVIKVESIKKEVLNKAGRGCITNRVDIDQRPGKAIFSKRN